MMLGLQGSTSSTKVYRCVACSATFNGLASLLVHQASHADTLSKVTAAPPTQPDVSPNELPLGGKEPSSQLLSPPASVSESPSPSFFICDCGEEFHDFDLMLKHKNSHASQPMDNNSGLSGTTGCDNAFPNQLSPSATESGLVRSCPSTSKSPVVQKDPDSVESLTSPQDQCVTPEDGCEPEKADEKIPELVEDGFLEEKTNSDLDKTKGDSLPKNDAIMKLLASAYMKRLPLSQNKINQNDDAVTPKQEIVPVDVTQRTTTAPINDLSIAQLRRLLAKPGIKTKAPSISRMLDSSRKRVVSLTKMLSPVIVLETRQKLMDPNSNGRYGRYQCGRCRRVFQNVDRLTEHHFLHKKERIKCCRWCKQLIIGRLPFNDNHVCPQMVKKGTQLSGSLKNKFSFGQKLTPFHSLNNTKKVYFCPLCKHSYARRYTLKMHNCQGRPSPRQTNPFIDSLLALRSDGQDKDADDDPDADGLQPVKNIAVGTEVTGQIKVEVNSHVSEQAAGSELAWNRSAKGFIPFLSKSPLTREQDWDSVSVDNENSNESQWTMPLDDEGEAFSSGDNVGSDSDEHDATSSELAQTGLGYSMREDLKRFPCNRCHKTYSRASTLSRHLRLCGLRARGIVAQSGSQAVVPLIANKEKPMFPCAVCGRLFSRKDNMMVHFRKCQLNHAGDGKTAQQNKSRTATEASTTEDDGGNWGIMSLPSVLPRRVTCECGVGFTSPRLLLEHLQKHAQESYTCPTCGETVNSWADYEIHLQIHMHPHHHLLKGLQPQRSQPLLIRFQQQSAQQPPQKQPQLGQLPNPGLKQQQQQQQQQPSQSVRHPGPKLPSLGHFASKRQQRIVCSRCGNSFANHCSLRRHLSWNRCKGVRVTSLSANPPKTYHCSHCNSDFPNTISLIFHQRSGACKPAIKPVRCPVCLRWFGTVVGLQKHLLTHKQSETYRCDVCQGTYPNLKSLKNHRRRIHRIMAAETPSSPQELLTSS